MLTGRFDDLPGHVRWWLRASGSSIIAVMAMFVVTTASNRLVETPELKQLFDIGQELNVPTYVNTTLFTAVAAIALVVAITRSGSSERRAFGFVAVLSTFLAVDEAAGVHERFGAPTGRTLERWGVDWPTYSWVIPGAIVATAVALVGVRSLRRIPAATQRWLVIASAMFVGGAIGVEAINGWLRDLPSRPGYFVGTMIEETMEMAACAIAGAAMLDTVSMTISHGELRVAATEPAWTMSRRESRSTR